MNVRTLTVALASVAAAMIPPPGAHAAFPGRNGVIAFALDNSDRDGTGDIQTIRPDGSHRRTIYSEGYGGSGQLAPRFSADGTRIVFETDNQGELQTPDTDLRMMAADGTGVSAVGTQGPSIAPVWSADGSEIAYSDGTNLFTIDMASGLSTQLTSTGGTQPAWSIRNQIAYVSHGTIQVMTSPGGSAEALTKGSLPAFFPSGGKLAFVRRVKRVAQIFTIGVGGRHLRQITHFRRYSVSPAPSPDGRMIAFVHDEGPSENGGHTDHLWIMRSDGSRAHAVRGLHYDYDGLLQYEAPDWQPLLEPEPRPVARARVA